MLQWIAQNTLVAIGIAILAAAASLLLRRRPAAAHILWMCVLVALLAPPLPKLGWFDARAHARRLADRVERECVGLLPAWTAAYPTLSEPKGTASPSTLAKDDRTSAEPVRPDFLAKSFGPADWLPDDGVMQHAVPLQADPYPSSLRDIAATSTDAPWEWASDGATTAQLPTSSPAAVMLPHKHGPAPKSLIAPPNRRRATTSTIDWSGIGARAALLGWLAGAIVAAGRMARQLASLAELCRQGGRPEQDLSGAVSELTNRFGIPSPRVRVSPTVATPFVCGLIRPTLVWPAGVAPSAPGAEAVLAHELAHLARRDHWLAWLETCAAVVLWWHPLAHLARARARHLAERACDAWVVWAYPESRRDYADALLDAAEQLHERRRPIPALGAVDSDKRTLARRLVMIMNGNVVRHGSRALAIGAIALTAALSPTWARADGRLNPVMLTVGADIDKALRPLIEAVATARKAAASADAAEWDDAIRGYSRVVELRPEDSGAWHELAMAYYQSGAYDQAAEAFHRGGEVALKAGTAWGSLDPFRVRATTQKAMKAAAAQVAAANEQLAAANKRLAATTSQQAAVAEEVSKAQARSDAARARLEAQAERLRAEAALLQAQLAATERALDAATPAHAPGAELAEPSAPAQPAIIPASPDSVSTPRPAPAATASDPLRPTRATQPAAQPATAPTADPTAAPDPAWESFGSDADDAFAGFAPAEFDASFGALSSDPFGGSGLWGNLGEWAYNEACCLALDGQEAAALAALERALGLGYDDADHAGSDSDLESIRGSEKFTAILERMTALASALEVGQAADDGRWADAAKAYAEAATIADHDAAIYDQLGLTRLRAGDAKGAKLAWMRSLELGGDEARARYNIACAETAAGNESAAIESLSKAADAGFDDHQLIREDKDLAGLHGDERFEAVCKRVVGRAKLQREMQTAMEFEEWSEAAAKAQELLEQTPARSWEAASARSTLGTALLRSGDYEGAEAAFRDAALAGDGPVDQVYNIACCRALSGDASGAVAYLNAAVDAGYGDGEHMRADEDLESLRENAGFGAVAQRADDATVLQQFGASDWEQVRDRAKARIAADGEDGEAYLELGWSLLRTGKASEAIGAFEKQEALGAMPAIARYNIACCHAVLGHTDDALSNLKKAIRAGFDQADQMQNDPDLAGLRSDPRFEKLIESMNQSEDAAAPTPAPVMPKTSRSRI